MFDELEEYLSILSDSFDRLPESLEKIMIMSKVNELVFWLEMLNDKEKQAD